VGLAGSGLGLCRPLGVFQDLIDLDGQKTFAVHETAHHRAPLALHQYLHRAVGQAQHLDHIGQRPHRKDVFRGRLVALHTLRGKEDLLVVAARSDLAQRAQRFLAAHEERHHHVREDHGIAQGQERNATNPGCLLVTVGQGQPFLRGLLAAETLGVIVSGLIREANFCVVCFFTTGQGQETRGTTGKEVVRLRVPGQRPSEDRACPSEF
jgi:hypothetical protein